MGTYAVLTILLALVATTLAIYARVFTILNPKRRKPSHHASFKSGHLLIVLGSGGHTAEMLAMLQRAFKDATVPDRLDWGKFEFRTWVVGEGDALSARRAAEFEAMATGSGGKLGGAGESGVEGFTIRTVPRARKVHQSLLTAPASSLKTLVAALKVLINPSPAHDLPDIVLTNGPATAAIFILAAVILRFFNVQGCYGRGKLRTVYVESWARVRRLSLTGRLVQGVVDRFVVQWPQLVGDDGSTGGAGKAKSWRLGIGRGREYGGWLV